jgi:hypothetical protein
MIYPTESMTYVQFQPFDLSPSGTLRLKTGSNHEFISVVLLDIAISSLICLHFHEDI